MKTAKIIFAAWLILTAAASAFAQSPSTNVQTQQLTLLPQVPITVTGISAAPSVQGSTAYFYWVVAHVGAEVSAPQGPAVITNGPTTLSSSFYNSIQWSEAAGATSYDVLRSSSSATPSGACNCAVITGTSNLSAIDQSNSLLSYTVSTSADQINLICLNTNGCLGSGGASLIYPPIVVNGTTVTTVAQALTMLGPFGGTIDARKCTPGSLALGTYDPPVGTVLLLGSCTYTTTGIIEEPQETIEGAGSYGGTTIQYTPNSGAAMFQPNTSGHDLSSMVYKDFAIANVGSSTTTACAIVDPSQTNTSAEQNQIRNVLFENLSSTVPCIQLTGTASSFGGENEVNSFLIEDNTFFINSAAALAITGAVSSVAYIGNNDDATGASVTCSSSSAAPLAVLVSANSFFNESTGVSNSGCKMVTIANLANGAFLADSFASQIPYWAGAIIPGDVASWSSAGVLQDGGSSASAPAVQASYFKTLASNLSPVSGTPLTVLTQTATMPSTGCPCRALVSYGTYAQTNNQTWNTWVSDGAYSMASAQATGAGSNNIGLSASQMSQVSYQNNDAITFTETVEVNGTGATVTAAPTQGSGTNTWMNVSILPATVDGFDKFLTQTTLSATNFSIGPIGPASLSEVPLALSVGDAGAGLPTCAAAGSSSNIIGAIANGSALVTGAIANPTTLDVACSTAVNQAAVLALLKLSGTFSVAQVTGATNTTGTSTTKTFTSNVTAGHAVLAIFTVSNGPASNTILQVTDSEGNLYQSLGTVFLAGTGGHDNIQATMMIATNVVGGTMDAVTFKTSQAQSFGLVGISELAGIQ